jgi:hypothetical protein
MQDLFDTPELIPANVQAVLEQHTADKLEMDYKELAAMLADVEKLGYTFDYYLDCIPFNLTKI